MFVGTQHEDKTTSFFLVKYVEFIYVVLVQDTVRFACMKEELPLSVNSSLTLQAPPE